LVRSEPRLEAAETARLRGGILLPVTEQREGFLGVLTPCEARGWVAIADVDVHARATGNPTSLRQATIVIDPGHGGQLDGAVGPSGLPEKEPNADIASRLAGRLEGARVFVTLSGDITGGLIYRSAIANALSAHVFVSVHNNAEPDGPSSKPGTETYYQHRSASSKRLAGLLYEELVPALTPFGTDWVTDRDAGAKHRIGTGQTDYYGLLRRTRVPAVIVEALFVSHAPEEALLRRSDVRDSIAGALATGLRRYFESRDPGSGFVEPYPREPGPSGRLPSRCNEPAP
jgi:N-acetylmuramoyl-L-alanine amidase